MPLNKTIKLIDILKIRDLINMRMSMPEKIKAKILRSLIIIMGLICLYAFIAIRAQAIFNLGVNEKLVTGYWDNTKYGELYYFNYVKHFKEENLPQMGEKYQYSPMQASPEDAEILIFGDSFFDICRPTQFPTEISVRLNKKVHFAYNDYPLQYLNQINYNSKEPKLLLMGSVERYIPVKFANQHNEQFTIDSRSQKIKMLSSIKNKVFYYRSEELYDALLKRSYLTTDIYSIIATVKFDCFEYISKLTPKYSLQDTIPWIFYHDEVNGKITSFYYKHTDDEFEKVSDNILDLSRQLKTKYNIELIIIPIPAKYTICHNRINNDQYSNFLPKLQEKFDHKGIKYIDFYDTFRKSKDILYIPTDGHWNEKGLELGVELTLNYLEKNYGLQ
jgi:hypothetical protein